MIDHSTRDHALLSASSAHRWLACPPSAVAAEAYAQQDTEYTREGTLAHMVAEWVASGKSKSCNLNKGLDDGITPEMLDHARGYADYIEEQKHSGEVVELLEQRVDFSPWVPDGFGTCDCILIEGSVMTIIDYKYGVGVPVSAEDNPQLRLYALGALNDYGFAYDVTQVAMHIYQPRINTISSSSLMVEDLLEWAEKTVKPTARDAAKGKGKYTAGVHCKFCPHAGRCRALTKVCTEYVETHSLRAAVPVLAPHEVAEVLAMEPLVSLWLKRVKAQALTTLLDGGEIPGFKAVEGRASREWADEQRVVEILKDNGYTQDDYCKTELYSPAGMEGAIGKKLTAELLGSVIVKKAGAPTVVPASDRREPYDRLAEAQKDFK
nr:MAG TPA: PD-(D/E)XK nuclease superfamily protein [Caudoviricetes sp.]